MSFVFGMKVGCKVCCVKIIRLFKCSAEYIFSRDDWMNISSEFEGESSFFTLLTQFDIITAKVSLAIILLSSEQKLNDIDYWLSHVTKRCNVNTGFSAKDFFSVFECFLKLVFSHCPGWGQERLNYFQ